MLNLFNAAIDVFSVHQVKNKSRSEGKFLSDKPYSLNDEFTALLKEYFFKPFRDKEEHYFKFTHDVDLDYHQVYNYAKRIFDNPDSAHEVSKEITSFLYEQSAHPHIKNGEVYVAYITGVVIDNKPVDAIGIFKSEIKEDFLQFDKHDTYLELILQQGVNLSKLDKGCLIFNIEAEEGYKVLSIDNNRYDTRYWLDHFLSVEESQDDIFFTKKYLKFADAFAKEVVRPAEDAKEEVMFKNRAIDYFAKNDLFEEDKFLREVCLNPDLIPEFKNFKIEQGPKYSVEDLDEFEISNSAVNEARKKINSTISLDTNITIKLDFINPESAEKFIEKGWDEEKQMYYYLVYFNKEQKV